MTILNRFKNLTTGITMVVVGLFLSNQSLGGLGGFDAVDNGFKLIVSAFTGHDVRIE